MNFIDILCAAPEVQAYEEKDAFCGAVAHFAENSLIEEAIIANDKQMFHDEFTRLQGTLSYEHNQVLWSIIDRVAGGILMKKVEEKLASDTPPQLIEIEDFD